MRVGWKRSVYRGRNGGWSQSWRGKRRQTKAKGKKKENPKNPKKQARSVSPQAAQRPHGEERSTHTHAQCGHACTPRCARDGARLSAPRSHRFSSRSEEEGVETPGPPRAVRARARAVAYSSIFLIFLGVFEGRLTPKTASGRT